MSLDESTVRFLLPKFRDATEKFYSGQMSPKEFKGISGLYGSYAQRGGEAGMVRLRLSGGRIDMPKLRFIVDAIESYRPSMVHITTCQSLQLHNLPGEDIPEIMYKALDAGIFTFQTGGDNPRNITATPLSGVIEAPFDVQPYAACAEEYLRNYVYGKKMPRKLKVGFSNTPENGTDSTARDLGFVATGNGKFDVYSGGGLGPNPRLGLLVYRDADPKDLYRFLTAMVDMFIECGNFENRAKARVRYMRDTLGDDGYISKFNEHLRKAKADASIPDTVPGIFETIKMSDGSIPSSPRARKQKQEGLYYVSYHPLGGDPAPEKFGEIYEAVKEMEGVEIRLSPAETLYVVNLTGSEADRVAEVLNDGAKTLFEASVSCVGATICQQGLRDSHGLLLRLIDMERRNGFADGVLPLLRISGCTSSCSAHQLGTIGLRGTSLKGEPAFVVNVNGSHILGRERIGEDVGVLKESDAEAFFETLGKAVEASGKKYRDWYNDDPSRLLKVCGHFLN